MRHVQEEIPESKKPESLASLVRRLGNPESTTLLLSSCRFFQVPHIDGVIVYQESGKCAVVVGDPICLPKDTAELTQAFHLHCERRQLKIVYFLVCQEFAHWAIGNGCRTSIQVGQEASVNPLHFQKKQKLRWKMNQSLQQGVTIKEYRGFDPSLENQLHGTIATWLKQKHGPQIHLGSAHLFNSHTHRLFYAQKKDTILGLLILFPLDRFQGWVVSSYLAVSEAPVGTTEHLLCSTIDSLAKENCPFLCLGLVPGDKLGEMQGTGPVCKALAHLIFKTANWLFHLQSKATYLKKYQPRFRSTFIVCRDKLTFRELFAMKHVLNVKL